MSIEEQIIPEVYKDLAKPAVKELGEVAGRTAKVLLSPIRGFLWGCEQIEQLIVDGVNQRLENIPEEQRKTPDPEVAVPLIQSLSYTAQNPTLREMYLNLLANSMDKSMDRSVHPSFVELIKKMNTIDAKVFEILSFEKGYQKAINPSIQVNDTKKIFIDATPEWFAGWKLEGHDIFEVSSSIVRLSKFGLIELMFDRTAGYGGYKDLESHEELQVILQKYRNANPSIELDISVIKSVIYVNEYGLQFKKSCR